MVGHQVLVLSIGVRVPVPQLCSGILQEVELEIIKTKSEMWLGKKQFYSEASQTIWCANSLEFAITKGSGLNMS
jgi:hypothetical protein